MAILSSAFQDLRLLFSNARFAMLLTMQVVEGSIWSTKDSLPESVPVSPLTMNAHISSSISVVELQTSRSSLLAVSLTR